MLKAIPSNWLSWDFRVSDGGREVAEMGLSFWREKGSLSIEGIPYRVYREGPAHGAFILEDPGGRIVVRAEKPSALRRSFLVGYDGWRLTLEARSAFGRTFVLRDSQGEIGSVRPDNIVTRRATADFPEAFPLPVRIFLLWLVFILWRRDDDSAGAPPAA